MPSPLTVLGVCLQAGRRREFTMKRIVFGFLLAFLSFSPAILFADEIQLYCEGPTKTHWFGIEQSPSRVELVVNLDTKNQHIKVQWGANILLDHKMDVLPNHYTYTKYKEGNQIARSFSINRTNLTFHLLMTDYLPEKEGPYILESKGGQCAKFAPKI